MTIKNENIFKQIYKVEKITYGRNMDILTVQETSNENIRINVLCTEWLCQCCYNIQKNIRQEKSRKEKVIKIAYKH